MMLIDLDKKDCYVKLEKQIKKTMKKKHAVSFVVKTKPHAVPRYYNVILKYRGVTSNLKHLIFDIMSTRKADSRKIKLLKWNSGVTQAIDAGRDMILEVTNDWKYQ